MKSTSMAAPLPPTKTASAVNVDAVIASNTASAENVELMDASRTASAVMLSAPTQLSSNEYIARLSNRLVSRYPIAKCGSALSVAKPPLLVDADGVRGSGSVRFQTFTIRVLGLVSATVILTEYHVSASTL